MTPTRRRRKIKDDDDSGSKSSSSSSSSSSSNSNSNKRHQEPEWIRIHKAQTLAKPGYIPGLGMVEFDAKMEVVAHWTWTFLGAIILPIAFIALLTYPLPRAAIIIDNSLSLAFIPLSPDMYKPNSFPPNNIQRTPPPPPSGYAPLSSVCQDTPKPSHQPWMEQLDCAASPGPGHWDLSNDLHPWSPSTLPPTAPVCQLVWNPPDLSPATAPELFGSTHKTLWLFGDTTMLQLYNSLKNALIDPSDAPVIERHGPGGDLDDDPDALPGDVHADGSPLWKRHERAVTIGSLTLRYVSVKTWGAHSWAGRRVLSAARDIGPDASRGWIVVSPSLWLARNTPVPGVESCAPGSLACGFIRRESRAVFLAAEEEKLLTSSNVHAWILLAHPPSFSPLPNTPPDGSISINKSFLASMASWPCIRVVHPHAALDTDPEPPIDHDGVHLTPHALAAVQDLLTLALHLHPRPPPPPQHIPLITQD